MPWRAWNGFHAFTESKSLMEPIHRFHEHHRATPVDDRDTVLAAKIRDLLGHASRAKILMEPDPRDAQRLAGFHHI